MKIPLTLIAIVALVLAAGFLFAPEPDPELLKPRTDLPWQVTPNADGTSKVFDLQLGLATMADAQDKFGAAEKYAVFAHQDQTFDLEAYFGKVMFGPLKAKVVVQLEASEQEKSRLAERGGERQASPSGDWKYPLNPADHAEQSARRILAISYEPGTRGLDQDFFLSRFGEPAAVLQEKEHAVSWFYPDKGLSILIDEKGREVLEYVAPRDFTMPENVSPYRAAD